VGLLEYKKIPEANQGRKFLRSSTMGLLTVPRTDILVSIAFLWLDHESGWITT